MLALDSINSPIKSTSYDMKKVLGGLLVQDYDTLVIEDEKCKVVTEVKPTAEQLKDMQFLMRVCKHTKSNAIVIGKDNTTYGIGAGQVNRIWATKQAIEHSLKDTNGAVLASDAFFPFGDVVEEAHKAGIKAIVQPGGSIRDQESIDLCNKYGIAMIFTGDRHFKH